MGPRTVAAFFSLCVFLFSAASARVERHGQVEGTGGDDLTRPVVVLNLYYAKEGAGADVLETRMDASRVRRALGLPLGRILRRVDGPDALPDVIWECQFEDLAAHERDMAARAASVDFEAVRATMRPLLARFERSLWSLRREGDDLVDVPAISVINAYYPRPEGDENVLAHRIHASEVRRFLGYPEGRVLYRLSEGDLPRVLWQMDYVDLEARQSDSDGIGATPEFQEVMTKMQTLIRRFERGVYEIVEVPRAN